MMRQGTMAFFVAGCSIESLSAFAKRFLPDGWTIHETWGGGGPWLTERSYVLVAMADWDAPAHWVSTYPKCERRPDDGDAHQHGVLFPAYPDAIIGRARDIGENLALEFGQEAVAVTVTPCHFFLTTAQAIYKRNG